MKRPTQHPKYKPAQLPYRCSDPVVISSAALLVMVVGGSTLCFCNDKKYIIQNTYPSLFSPNIMSGKSAHQALKKKRVGSVSGVATILILKVSARYFRYGGYFVSPPIKR